MKPIRRFKDKVNPDNIYTLAKDIYRLAETDLYSRPMQYFPKGIEELPATLDSTNNGDIYLVTTNGNFPFKMYRYNHSGTTLETKWIYVDDVVEDSLYILKDKNLNRCVLHTFNKNKQFEPLYTQYESTLDYTISNISSNLNSKIDKVEEKLDEKIDNNYAALWSEVDQESRHLESDLEILFRSLGQEKTVQTKFYTQTKGVVLEETGAPAVKYYSFGGTEDIVLLPNCSYPYNIVTQDQIKSVKLKYGSDICRIYKFEIKERESSDKLNSVLTIYWLAEIPVDDFITYPVQAPKDTLEITYEISLYQDYIERHAK